MRRLFAVIIVAIAALLGGLIAIPASASSATFAASADTFADATSTGTNFGTASRVWADNDAPVRWGYLRFNVTGIPTGCTVSGASLKLTVGNSLNNEAPYGGDLYGVASTSWSETGLTWANKPATGTTKVASVTGAVAKGSSYTWNASSLVKGNGLVSMALKTTSWNGAGYYSREGSSTLGPRLSVTTTCPTATPTPTVSTSSPAPSPSPTVTATPAPSPTPTVTAAPSPSPSPTATAPAPSPTPTATATPPPTVTTLPRPDHIVIAIDENKDYSTIASDPYISGLAAQGVLMTDSHGVSHPSEPNYLALWSGSTQGITDDSCPHTFTTNNLGAQLIAAGRNAKIYSETMPSDGYTGCTYSNYARKHNPLVNWTQTADASHNLTYAAWPTDYTTLPAVSMVVPNLCDDMHDCSVSTGSTWLKNHIDAYAQWAKTHNSLLILTFDEDSSSTTSNHIYTVLIGEHVQVGVKSAQTINHYNVLHTIEQTYGLSLLGPTAAPISNIWK